MQNLSLYLNKTNEDENISSDNADLMIKKFNAINYYYLAVFCSSVIGGIIFTYSMVYRFFMMGINASKNMHNQMFRRYFSILMHLENTMSPCLIFQD